MKIRNDTFYLEKIAPHIGSLRIVADPARLWYDIFYIIPGDSGTDPLYNGPHLRTDFLLHFRFVYVITDEDRDTEQWFDVPDEIVEGVAKNIDFFIDGRHVGSPEQERIHRQKLQDVSDLNNPFALQRYLDGFPVNTYEYL